MATSAETAAELLGDASGVESLHAQLRRIEYFDTTIAVHGDARLMPARRSAWSGMNARWAGVHSQLTVWNPARGLPVFRSWVTYGDAMPEPLYAVTRYRHAKVTPASFDAQRELRALKGDGGVWLASLLPAT